MTKITDDQIIDASNKAYIKAGSNAYFGNGFMAGIEFAIEVGSANEYAIKSALQTAIELLESATEYEVMDSWKEKVNELKKLLK